MKPGDIVRVTATEQRGVVIATRQQKLEAIRKLMKPSPMRDTMERRLLANPELYVMLEGATMMQPFNSEDLTPMFKFNAEDLTPMFNPKELQRIPVMAELTPRSAFADSTTLAEARALVTNYRRIVDIVDMIMKESAGCTVKIDYDSIDTRKHYADEAKRCDEFLALTGGPR